MNIPEHTEELIVDFNKLAAGSATQERIERVNYLFDNFGAVMDKIEISKG